MIKKLLNFSFCLFIAIYISLPINCYSLSYNYITFANKFGSYEIKHPSSWTIEKYSKEDNLVKFKPDSKSYLTILVQKLGSNETLDLIFKKEFNTIKSQHNFQLIEYNSTSLSESSAYKVIYTYNLPYLKENIKVMKMISVHANKLYSIEFLSSEKEYPNNIFQIQNTINSFKFSD